MKFKRHFVFLSSWIGIAAVLLLMSYCTRSIFDWKTVRNATDTRRYLRKTSTSDATMVLILTYMRSGSSLTGDIIQQSPGAFYLYEPLRILGKNILKNRSLEYVNGLTRQPSFEFMHEAYHVFKNWLTCNITSLPLLSLHDRGFLGKGLKSRSFYACLNNTMNKDSQPSFHFQKCVKVLQQLCEDSPLRVIKTIRVELSTVKQLFEELPTFKLIHLVRDPRSTLQSQAKYGRCLQSQGGFPGCINKYCTRLENDVLEEEGLKEKYPERIMTVFYENIARNPIEASREIYEFCGAKFTEHAQKYIYNITMAGNPDNCGICTVRSNSTEHIDTWKETISTTFLNMIQERCNYVLKRYQYDIYERDK